MSTPKRFYVKPDEWEPTGHLPKQAVLDCSHAGPCDDDVAYWVASLRFDAPEDKTRAYLKEFGAWDQDDLADHAANLERLFWLWCGDRKQDPTCYLSLMS